MSEQQFELSQKGVKFSYKRFLSDSAPGYLLLLFIVIGYYYPIVGIRIQDLLNESFSLKSSLPKETKAVIILLLFLLSTPIGLMVNAISYIMMTPIINFLEKRRIDKKQFWLSEWDNYALKICKKIYLLNNSNWLDIVNIFSAVLKIHHKDIIESNSHTEALGRFLRSISLLVLLYSIILLFSNYYFAFALAILSLSMIFICSRVYFHFHLSILFEAFIVSLDQNDNTITLGNVNESLGDLEEANVSGKKVLQRLLSNPENKNNGNKLIIT